LRWLRRATWDQSATAPQVMLKDEAVMARAPSEAAKAATLPTSSSVAARPSIVASDGARAITASSFNITCGAVAD
jgi:hypothetical protein